MYVMQRSLRLLQSVLVVHLQVNICVYQQLNKLYRKTQNKNVTIELYCPGPLTVIYNKS